MSLALISAAGSRGGSARSRSDARVIPPGGYGGRVFERLTFDLLAGRVWTAPGLSGGHPREPLLECLKLTGLVVCDALQMAEVLEPLYTGGEDDQQVGVAGGRGREGVHGARRDDDEITLASGQDALAVSISAAPDTT